MGNHEPTRVTAETTESVPTTDDGEIEALIEDVSGPAHSDTGLYYMRIHFDGPRTRLQDKKHLVDELARSEAQTSVDVRLDHVHSRMDTFAAYVDALEAFIDEEGTAQQLLAELRADLESVRADLEAAAEERDDLARRVADLETSVPSADAVESKFSALERALETEARERRAETDDLESELARVESEIDDQQEWRRRLSSALVSSECAD
ncbi:hypothetical protein [Natrinema caseinilyticum]|uniref:hypothetical protein n=1 Tax=Natrinema caseinilyticum TaxID=2961570 RepID=UPI0020C3603D|nr:hypothetical protein [Natrinema caseinilyticum]